MQAPQLIKQIPAQVINEQAALGPFDLKNFIADPDNTPLQFQAELANGEPLPKGMICTGDGVLTGIPARGTKGNYKVIVNAKNEAGELKTDFTLTIKPSLLTTDTEYADQLKTQVWQALEQNLPLPDLGELLNRPVSVLDVYYLLERWATLIIWDAFNLDAPGEKVLLKLEKASPHYNVYDRGSCLVAAPKDLYSHERTLEDALQTARAMAEEVYNRNWTIELAGFEKMVRSAWVEIQHLNDISSKKVEILNFDPTIKELRIYNEENDSIALRMQESI